MHDFIVNVLPTWANHDWLTGDLLTLKESLIQLLAFSLPFLAVGLGVAVIVALFPRYVRKVPKKAEAKEVRRLRGLTDPRPVPSSVVAFDRRAAIRRRPPARFTATGKVIH